MQPFIWREEAHCLLPSLLVCNSSTPILILCTKGTFANMADKRPLILFVWVGCQHGGCKRNSPSRNYWHAFTWEPWTSSHVRPFICVDYSCLHTVWTRPHPQPAQRLSASPQPRRSEPRPSAELECPPPRWPCSPDPQTEETGSRPPSLGLLCEPMMGAQMLKRDKNIELLKCKIKYI